MSLMNGARIGIAAQSLGIAEAAYRVARDYAASRKQFAVAIEKLPAVRDMLIDMKIAIEAGRALLYETSRVVDLDIAVRQTGWRTSPPPRQRRAQSGSKSEPASSSDSPSMLTPMSKYYCSEMCNRVAYDAIQVLGGSGYMRDYACERLRPRRPHHDDLRRHQPVAGRRRRSRRLQRHGREIPGRAGRAGLRPEVRDLLEMLAEGTEQLKKPSPSSRSTAMSTWTCTAGRWWISRST